MNKIQNITTKRSIQTKIAQRVNFQCLIPLINYTKFFRF